MSLQLTERRHAAHALCMLVAFVAIVPDSSAQPAPAVPAAEFAAHRAALLAALPNGITLVRSTSTLPASVDFAFVQDPSFYYLTGLESEIGSVLVLDGPKRESWLFVPTHRSFPFFPERAPAITADERGVARSGIAHVLTTDSLGAFIDRRLAEASGLMLYTPGPVAVDDTNPRHFPPLDGHAALWAREVHARWPQAPLRATDTLSALRTIKGPGEIAALRRVAAASAQALLAGIRSVRPEREQRLAAVDVVRACVTNGMIGPSFWPWVMSGPAGAFPTPMGSLTDYEYLDRIMHAGELVRVDVGCQSAHYNGDVGRTVPVSGRFDPGQREVWNLLVDAWRAGLARMRDGASADSVKAAARHVFESAREHLHTALGEHAVASVLGPDGMQFWEVHGVGLDDAEGLPVVLRAGMVVAWEPILSVDGQGFYLEDMILITPTGAEVLTTGLPYTADEIERASR